MSQLRVKRVVHIYNPEQQRRKLLLSLVGETTRIYSESHGMGRAVISDVRFEGDEVVYAIDPYSITWEVEQ